MSAKEFDRLEIIGRVAERRMTQWKAAERLVLSLRQVERLCRSFRKHGAAGLVSRKRGSPSNRKYSAAYRERALEIVRAHYADFGPTLACEKLTENHGVAVSVETLRKWMIEDGLWIPRARRRCRVYQPRMRRSCMGELVQIDGCEHGWFEDRAPKCTLLVYIDDATSRLMELRFVESESTFDYFISTKAYLKQHGKPVAYYSDKASIFRVAGNKHGRTRGITQFGRALSELNIDILCAKLQDRLVKELRLRDITSIEAGNAYLPDFMDDYNQRFARDPENPHDAHRPVRGDEDLELILTCQEMRKLSKNLALIYKRVTYLVEPGPDTLPIGGKWCRVYEHEDGRVEIRYDDRPLPYCIFSDRDQCVRSAAIVTTKRLDAVLRKIREDQQKQERKSRPRRKLTLREKRLIRAARERTDACSYEDLADQSLQQPDISTLEKARHF
jgi:transposase